VEDGARDTPPAADAGSAGGGGRVPQILEALTGPVEPGQLPGLILGDLDDDGVGVQPEQEGT
jgi:hypothetical protein